MSKSANTKLLFNLEAEAEVLGAILRENHCLSEVIDFIKAEDFYDARHKLLYKAMVELYSKGEVNPSHSAGIDVVTLSEKVGPLLSELGGTPTITYISGIAASSCTSENIREHAKIVKEKATLRAIQQILTAGASLVTSRDAESSTVIPKLLDKLSALQGNNQQENGNLSPHLVTYIDKLQKCSKNGGGIQGIKTGYNALDAMTGGFNRQDYIVLAARPSMGKSAFSTNLALHMALKQQKKIAYFNLEMSIEQVLQRSLAIQTTISMNRLKNANLEDEEWCRLALEAQNLTIDHLRIFENTLSLADMKAQCKRLKLQMGLDIVFIDYLQLIKGEGKQENRNADISSISRALKQMAKELDVTVLALSQLSRAPETRADHRPMLADLRDSGSIEQDADMVMFLYRDAYYDPETEEPDALECIIGKNRNGRVGTVKLKWRGAYQQVRA